MLTTIQWFRSQVKETMGRNFICILTSALSPIFSNTGFDLLQVQRSISIFPTNLSWMSITCSKQQVLVSQIRGCSFDLSEAGGLVVIKRKPEV